MSSPDFILIGGPRETVYLLSPVTPKASELLDRIVRPDAIWLGDALAIEPDFIIGLISGLKQDGFTVAWSFEDSRACA